MNKWLVAIVSIVYLGWTLPAIWQGPYNPDEGWYLNSAWLTGQGHVPYRDFGFPQPPLFLFIHGLGQIILGPSWYMGRFLSVLIGLATVLVAMKAGEKLGGTRAVWWVGVLLAFSPWWAIQMVTISTYALASLFVVAALWAWLSQRWFWFGFLALAAVWTRLPLAPLIGWVVLIPLLQPHSKWLAWSRTAIGGLVGALILVAPWFLVAPQATWLNVVGFHTYTRQALLPTFTWDSFWAQYGPIYQWWWAVAILSSVILLWKRPLGWSKVLALGVLALIIAVPQAVASNVTYDVPLIPILSLIGGVGLAYILSQTKPEKVYSALTLLAIVYLMTTSHIDYYRGKGEHEEGMANVRRVSRYLTQHSQPTDYVLTPELYVSVQAGRPALPGSELGRFWYFPEFNTEQARARGVMNDELLQAAIQKRQAKFIVLNMAHLWNNLPRVEDNPQRWLDMIAQAGYAPVKQLHEYQPAVEMLRVYERQE